MFYWKVDCLLHPTNNSRLNVPPLQWNHSSGSKTLKYRFIQQHCEIGWFRLVNLHGINVIAFVIVGKEKLFVEHWTTFAPKSSWEPNMMKWLMYGVLVSFAMSFALAMLPSNLQKVGNKPIKKFLILIWNSQSFYLRQWKILSGGCW